MEIEIDPRITVEQNAARYYESSKKYRRKLEGLKKAIAETQRLIKAEEKIQSGKKELQKKTVREKEWFEKYHWSFIGKNLAIGGRDAKTNDILVKKHLEKNDLFYHADVHGAAVFIAKNGQEYGEKELEEVALLTACFSSAWKAGRGNADAYAVKPEQVKTAAKSGEYLAKGSFVITGERKWFRNIKLELAVSFESGKLVIGPPEKFRKKIIIRPEERGAKGEAAKKVLKKLHELFPESKGAVDINWVLEMLPNGGSRVTS